MISHPSHPSPMVGKGEASAPSLLRRCSPLLCSSLLSTPPLPLLSSALLLSSPLRGALRDPRTPFAGWGMAWLGHGMVYSRRGPSGATMPVRMKAGGDVRRSEAGSGGRADAAYARFQRGPARTTRVTTPVRPARPLPTPVRHPSPARGRFWVARPSAPGTRTPTRSGRAAAGHGVSPAVTACDGRSRAVTACHGGHAQTNSLEP
jgi:hypothetical protein